MHRKHEPRKYATLRRKSVLFRKSAGETQRVSPDKSEFIDFCDVFVQPLEVVDVDSAVAVDIGYLLKI